MQCPFPIYFSSSPVRALQLPRTVANMHTHTRLHTYKDSLFFYRCWLRSSLTLMCAPLCILPKIAALARSQKTWFSIHVHVHAYRGRHVTAYIIILPAAVLVDAFCPFLRRSFLPSSLFRYTASARSPVVSPRHTFPKTLPLSLTMNPWWYNEQLPLRRPRPCPRSKTNIRFFPPFFSVRSVTLPYSTIPPGVPGAMMVQLAHP